MSDQFLFIRVDRKLILFLANPIMLVKDIGWFSMASVAVNI
jgi:hypothetical protein